MAGCLFHVSLICFLIRTLVARGKVLPCVGSGPLWARWPVLS